MFSNEQKGEPSSKLDLALLAVSRAQARTKNDAS